MMLQQSSSFKELPGELASFLRIAWLAGQYQITHVIARNIGSSDARKWEGMLNLEAVLPFSLFFDAFELRVPTCSIIASIVLSLQLLLDLCGSMGPFTRTFKGSSTAYMHANSHPMLLSIVPSIDSSALFTDRCHAIQSCLFHSKVIVRRWLYLLTTSTLFHLSAWLERTSLIFSLPDKAVTRSAPRTQPSMHDSPLVKVLSSGRKHLLTGGALFHAPFRQRQQPLLPCHNLPI